jgi:hypothetical protein
MSPSDLDHTVDVTKVEHLRHVGRRETYRRCVAVHRDDAETPASGLLDRPPLVATRTDEEDSLHARRW